MKTTAQSLIAALLLSTATFAAPLNTPPMPTAANPTVTTNSYRIAVFPSSVAPTKVHVYVEHQPGKAMNVYLRDARGNVLATQRIGRNDSKVRFKFDLAELTDGNYRVDVACGSDQSSHPIMLTTETPVTPARVITID